MMQTLAPILLLVYDRPKQTRQTLAALEKNPLAKDSLLYIVSDAPKNAQAVEAVNQVRALIREPWHFQHINIIERQRNRGAAESLIDAVSRLIRKHGKLIILEDHLETSPHTLRYFNDALYRYQADDLAMAVSGYMYPVEQPKMLPKSFFFRAPNGWGWATWERAWNHFEADIKILTSDLRRRDKQAFSLEGSEDFWKQVKAYRKGKTDSWLIRWYLSMFKRNGLVLYPRQSLIKPLPTDPKKEMAEIDDRYQVSLATQRIKYFPQTVVEEVKAYEAIKYFYAHRRGNIVERFARFLLKKFGKI